MYRSSAKQQREHDQIQGFLKEREHTTLNFPKSLCELKRRSNEFQPHYEFVF